MQIFPVYLINVLIEFSQNKNHSRFIQLPRTWKRRWCYFDTHQTFIYFCITSTIYNKVITVSHVSTSGLIISVSEVEIPLTALRVVQLTASIFVIVSDILEACICLRSVNWKLKNYKHAVYGSKQKWLISKDATRSSCLTY